MRIRKLKLTSILSGAALFLGACGGDGNSTFGGANQLGEFKVSASDPAWQAQLVPLQSPIRVTFTEPVDSASATSSVQVQETIGGTAKNITAEGTLSVADNTLVFALSRSLQPNAQYRMTLPTSLRSTVGHNLVALTYIDFTTGLNGVVGDFISVDGPPKVTDISPTYSYSTGSTGCLAFQITYNEDLAKAPDVDGTICAFRYKCDSQPRQQMNVYPSYQGNLRTYIAEFYSCDPAIYSLDTRLVVYVKNAIDRTGEMQSGTESESFDSSDNLF